MAQTSLPSALVMNVPSPTSPTTQSVRDNFTIARNELDRLVQDVGALFSGGGTAGPAGATGATGPSGAAGASGAVGATGPSGAAGGGGGGGPPVTIAASDPDPGAADGNLWYDTSELTLKLRWGGIWSTIA